MKRTLVSIASLVLLVAAGSGRAEPIKVHISVDMEGISGVVDRDQVVSEGRDYGTARRWMTEDVNAVIAGLVAAGATEIIVNDSHGTMRNILPDLLRPEAALISGSPKALSMMAGIDRSFDASVLVGYHGHAGSEPGILDHTIASASVYRIAVNGIEMPELGLNALIAGTYGVPVIMLAGDAAACRQAQALLGDEIVTVAVKEAVGRTAALLPPMAETRRHLEDGARVALLHRAACTPYRLAPPFNFEVTFLNAGKAEPGELIPGVTRTDARTLTFSDPDFVAGFKLLRALITLASTR